MLGGIEAGGTKFVCAVGEAPDRIEDKLVIPTETPEKTFSAVRDFFRAHLPLEALGVASFGPIDLSPASSAYGALLNTPKLAWRNASYIKALSTLDCPIAVDTDVNGAALGEQTYGAGQGCDTLAYVTVGTGIGAGVVHQGKSLIGAGHYELGHIRPPRDPERDPYEGCCPSHGDCLEGLASGPAIMERWGAALNELSGLAPAIDLIADYLGHLALTLALAHRPDRILFGGGVMKTPGLIESVRVKTFGLVGGYVDLPAPDRFIQPPGLGDDAGVVGAVRLAENMRTQAG